MIIYYLYFTENQFQIVAVRRSTVTSMSSNKALADVVRTKPISFASYVKKNRVAILCIGELGKKKIEGRNSESNYTKKGDRKGTPVTQTVKVKRKLETEELLKGKRSEHFDASAKMTRRSERPSHDNSSTSDAVTSKLHKWRNVCGKLSAKV